MHGLFFAINKDVAEFEQALKMPSVCLVFKAKNGRTLGWRGNIKILASVIFRVHEKLARVFIYFFCTFAVPHNSRQFHK